MSGFRFQLAVSLDGFVAGPDQSEENPLGVGGMELHQWVFKLVLTHHPRGPLEMEGGASVVQQYLAAGLVDEFELHVVPVLLGATAAVGSPGVATRVPAGDGAPGAAAVRTGGPGGAVRLPFAA
jgi:hypothetical protein